MKDRSLIKNYTSGPIARQLIIFALPFMASNLLQTAYNLVDMAVVGRFCGSAGLAGVSNGTDLIHFFTFVGIGISTAAQILVSQYVGTGNRDGIRRLTGTLLTFSAAVGILLTVVGLLWADVFLSWLNVPAEAMADAIAYSRMCFVGTTFCCGYFAVGGILRGMGDSTRPFIFMSISAVLNIILDVIFVSNGMGPFGAALATVIAQVVSCVISLFYMLIRRDVFEFDFRLRSFIPSGQVLSLLVSLSLPMILHSMAISFSTLFVNSFVNRYGVTAVAVSGIGSKLLTLAMIVTLSLNSAVSSMTGQNFAAGKFDRVRRTVWIALGIGASFCALLAAAVVAFPTQVFGVFNKDPAVLDMSRSYAYVLILHYLGFGLRAPMMALINGIGNARLNFVIGLLDGIILRIGLSMLLGIILGYGLQGLWYGSSIAALGYFIGGFPYFLSNRWEKFQPPVNRRAK